MSSPGNDRRHLEPIPLRLIEERRAAPPSLPKPLTSLVGREADVAAVLALFRDGQTRLVTLTGPGGVGKTRLALRVAEVAATDHPDGVWFVPLASVQDDRFVASAIAQVLEVRETGPRAIEDVVAAFLREKRALLVLDNFEHRLGAAPLVADLLSACDRLRVLVTSRAVLRLSGEYDYPVAVLPLPDPVEEAAAARAGKSEAVRLFVARARAAQPRFELTDANAADVATICRELDGLPLAIELAAARVRHFSLPMLRARLTEANGGAPFRVLADGPRDAPSRHRSLRDTIAWSYNLLSPAEQALFRRLAVFVGGFTLEAAEAVMAEGGRRKAEGSSSSSASVLDGLSALIDHSLVWRGAGLADEARYGMLETVREFGMEQLIARGEDEAARARHAAYVLDLAERGAPELFAADQRLWRERLDAEYANLRAALAWFDRTGAADAFLRLVRALLFFWWYQGYLADGLHWQERALATSGGAPEDRCWVTVGASMLALNVGDYDRQQALALEAQSAARAIGRPAAVGMATMLLAWVALVRGDPAAAGQHATTAEAHLRAGQDPTWLANGLGDVGLMVAQSGDPARGGALIEEALALDRDRGNRYFAAVRLSDLGLLAHDAGDEARAIAAYAESTRLLWEAGGAWYLASPLAGLAALAASRQPRAATRLLGAAVGLRERCGMPGWPTEDARDHTAAALARSLLGDEDYERELAAGRALSPAAAVADADALAETLTNAAPARPSPRTAAGTSGLSPREIEVLRLVVGGRSDRQIADELFISPRTASKHVANILAKLDVATRAEAAVHALRNGLV